MRSFISILAAMTFVITTTHFSSASNSMAGDRDGAMTAKPTAIASTADDHHDCSGNDMAQNTSSKTAQNNKDAPGKCCDKGVCKCVGGTCHNGLSHLFNTDGGTVSAMSVSSVVFAFNSPFIDSALSDRLQRPPKA